MNPRDTRADFEDEGRWWRLDFTTVLVLLVIVAFLMLLSFELWHSHPGIHLE